MFNGDPAETQPLGQSSDGEEAADGNWTTQPQAADGIGTTQPTAADGMGTTQPTAADGNGPRSRLRSSQCKT